MPHCTKCDRLGHIGRRVASEYGFSGRGRSLAALTPYGSLKKSKRSPNQNIALNPNFLKVNARQIKTLPSPCPHVRGVTTRVILLLMQPSG